MRNDQAALYCCGSHCLTPSGVLSEGRGATVYVESGAATTVSDLMLTA